MTYETHADRARMLGLVSIASSGLAIVVALFVAGPNPEGWEFFLCAGAGIAGVIAGLAGLDARRHCESDKPAAPRVGVVTGTLVTLAMLGMALFVSGIRHI